MMTSPLLKSNSRIWDIFSRPGLVFFPEHQARIRLTGEGIQNDQ